jgi:hypothetical protein
VKDDRKKLQDALDKLCEWACKWGMSFNVKKCKVMQVGHANKKGDYTMEGQTLGKTTEEKDIGVLVTGDLKPSNYCAKAANMATSVLRQIQKSFTYCDRVMFVKLCTPTFRVCPASMVGMAGGRQIGTGKSPGESPEDGVWHQGKKL